MSSPGMDLDPVERPRFLPEEEVESAFYLYMEVEDRARSARPGRAGAR